MSRKTIVLADSSYTIRRIVELSFSDEKDIQLIAFDNSINLKEKLLELCPQVVLADVKLPEFNGYDICKFIQETPGLKYTKVFLLKGGFEPIDERLLQNLRYEDIITKPFDSNALVSNIKKLLEKTPEDNLLPEPDMFSQSMDLPESDNDISFLDIKEEVDSDIPTEDEMDMDTDQSGPDELADNPREDPPLPYLSYPEDDILPSDEITLAHPIRETLAPTVEPEENPFGDEMVSLPENPAAFSDDDIDIKRSIELQEKELDMGSLTQAEFDIKKDIENRKDLDDYHDYDDQFSGFDEEPQHTFEVSDTGVAEEISEIFPDSKLDTSSRILIEDLEEPQPQTEIIPSFMEQGDDNSMPEDNDNVDDLFALPDHRSEPPAFDEAEEKLFDHGMAQVHEDEPQAVREHTFDHTFEPEPDADDELIGEAQEEDASNELLIERQPGESVQALSDEHLLRIEDRLTMVIKEMLWEILPPLAEKIIKEEIKAIKEEAEKSLIKL
ncbi:MAG: response regulator [Candidatus Omnitrophota bacterium]